MTETIVYWSGLKITCRRNDDDKLFGVDDSSDDAQVSDESPVVDDDEWRESRDAALKFFHLKMVAGSDTSHDFKLPSRFF